MQEQQNNPFNSKFLIAMVVFAVFYFGWNAYLQKKYPDYGKKPVIAATIDQKANNSNTTDAGLNNKASDTAGSLVDTKQNTTGLDSKTTNPIIQEKTLSFENDNISFEVSSRGMGIKNLKLKKYFDKDKNPILLGLSDSNYLFENKINDNKSVNYDLTLVGKNSFKGIVTLDGLTISRELTYNEELNSFENKVSITGINESNLKQVKFIIPEKITAQTSTSWLFPSYEHQDFLVKDSTTSHTVNFSSAKENISQSFKTTDMISLGSQYFATALLDRSDILPDAQVVSSVNDKSAFAEVIYPALAAKSEMMLTQTFFAGPKSIDVLKNIHEDLTNLINFGWMGFIAKPLLYSMKWFYTLVPNWGLAIILLTLMVRFFVLPFNLMSAKSMKAMQKIQPEMTALREKYKNDPMKMNQEVMNLMKQNKANPFGGCLPMLLQIPIFFALYRVIGSSIELYQSPFMLWITDLSQHDKFFVLPILMGITMFIQQKITPTNMDPAQAKILMYMPLVFTVFMVNLPSGLTLYMFVSALFGIIQQYFILKSKPA